MFLYLIISLALVVGDDYSTWTCMVPARRLYREPWRKESGAFRVALKRFGVNRKAFLIWSLMEFLVIFVSMLYSENVSRVSGFPLNWFWVGLLCGLILNVVMNNLQVARLLRGILAGQPVPYTPDLPIGGDTAT